MRPFFAIAALALTGCVASPQPVLPFNVSRLSGAGIAVDAAGSDLTADERSELVRALGRLRIEGVGTVRAIPAFSFRTATIAVVEKSVGTPKEAARTRSWFGHKKWRARYSLTVIDDGGKRLHQYAVDQLVGKNGREAARRACLGKLLSMLALAAPKDATAY